MQGVPADYRGCHDSSVVPRLLYDVHTTNITQKQKNNQFFSLDFYRESTDQRGSKGLLDHMLGYNSGQPYFKGGKFE